MMRKVLVALLLVASLSVAAANRCLAELQGEWTAEELSAVASARDAARLVERAVHLLEPALPSLARAGEVPLAAGDPDADTLRFLSERRLLPPGWTDAPLTLELWREMLGRLADWYQQPHSASASDLLTRADVLGDLSHLIERVAPTLRPVALVASDPADRNRVAFWATVRNDTVYPRMIVSRPPDAGEVTLRRGVEPILGDLSTCAMPVGKFVFAPADTALQLFLAHSEARMAVVQADGPDFVGVYYVPQGEERDHFAFLAPALEGVERYAVVFVGPSVGVTTVLRIIPQLRTNMGPREIIEFVTAP
jgi:hypothetical protein